MILSQIRQYLETHKKVPLGNLAVHFDTDPEAMRGMLQLWIQKGRIKKADGHASCCIKKCCSCCEAKSAEIYEWIH